jgi:hypothetical protein
MVSDTIVCDVAARPEVVPRLLEGFRREWPEWCASVSRPALEALFEGGADGRLPVVLVAMCGDSVQGTIALRPWFGEEPMAHTPWVRQLLVFPEFRGGRAYPALADAIVEQARMLGFEELYAATNRIEPLLVRGGWEVFRRVEHDGEPMAWLRKRLRD